MITITCTSCKKILNIDDAFAGAVCRCQFCGTIQTVPAKGSAQKASAGAAKGSKTLFQNKARTPGGGSGLDDLADIVHSSGLADSRLRKQSIPPPAPAKNNLTPLLGAAVAVIIILLIIVLVLIFRSPSGSAQAPAPESIPTGSALPAASFCGVPINSSVVVFDIDNGSSSADVLDGIKSALFKSLDSLGSNQRFQVLFWNPATPTYPSTPTTAVAVREIVQTAKAKLQQVTAGGSTEPIASLQRAMADNPGQIILVTANAGALDDSLLDQVLKLRGASQAKIDCIAINGVADDKILSGVASATGGHFLALPAGQLKSFGE